MSVHQKRYRLKYPEKQKTKAANYKIIHPEKFRRTTRETYMRQRERQEIALAVAAPLIPETMGAMRKHGGGGRKAQYAASLDFLRSIGMKP